MTTIKLSQLSPEEQKTIPYSALMRLRADAYTAHIATMKAPEAMSTWAAEMAARHGPVVKVWHNTLPWLEAFMVVRYGEEPAHWPKVFTEFDLIRAARWAGGKDVPTMVTMLPPAEATKEGSHA